MVSLRQPLQYLMVEYLFVQKLIINTFLFQEASGFDFPQAKSGPLFRHVNIASYFKPKGEVQQNPVESKRRLPLQVNLTGNLENLIWCMYFCIL